MVAVDAATAQAVHLERVLPAPREEVYRAWTDPELFSRWFGAHGGTTAADASPGSRTSGGESHATAPPQTIPSETRVTCSPRASLCGRVCRRRGNGWTRCGQDGDGGIH